MTQNEKRPNRRRFALRDIFVFVSSMAMGIGFLRFAIIADIGHHGSSVAIVSLILLGLFAIGGSFASFVGKVWRGTDTAAIWGYIVGGALVSIFPCALVLLLDLFITIK